VVVRRSMLGFPLLTARAKGLGNARVLCWHVLPNAAPQRIPVVLPSTLAPKRMIPLE
jgi:hypothetical protein